MIPIINSKRQYETIGADVEKAVVEVLRSGQYILGKNNQALQEELAKYIGVKHTVTLNSGTDALHLALRALDIGKGDEVITVAFTFVATTESVEIVGATPVFVDIDKDTFNMDAKTKAIMPVHLYGQPCDMDVIMDVAKRYNLHVIEDCCQAIGAEYKGKKVGTFGDIGCYSFYPTKNLGAMGDGGLVTTNSDYLKDRIVALRPYIDTWNKKRREHAALYNKLFAQYPDIETPKELDNTYCVYHQYTIKVPNRDEVHKLLQEAGIGAMIYYPIPLHMQKVHAHLHVPENSLPVTVENTKHVLSLPMFPEITEEEQKTVVEEVVKAVEKAKAMACC